MVAFLERFSDSNASLSSILFIHLFDKSFEPHPLWSTVGTRVDEVSAPGRCRCSRMDSRATWDMGMCIGPERIRDQTGAETRQEWRPERSGDQREAATREEQRPERSGHAQRQGRVIRGGH